MKLKIFFIGVISFLGAWSYASQPQDQSEFIVWLEIFSESGKIISSNKLHEDMSPTALALYDKISQKSILLEIQPEIDLLRARLLYYGRRNAEANEIIQATKIKYTTLMPEWLLLECHIADENMDKPLYNQLTTEVGRLLPFSFWGTRADSILGYKKEEKLRRVAWGAKPRGYSWSYPLSSRNIDQFKELGLLGDETETIVMGIYADLLGNEYPKDAWLNVGINEKKLGHKKLAAIAFLRAAQDQPEKLSELQNQWLENESTETQAPTGKLPNENADMIADTYTQGGYWPWAIDILKRAENIDHKKISDLVNRFQSNTQRAYKFNPKGHYWGVPASEITDFENFHLAKPSETFWNEEILYVPKEEITTP